MDFVMDGLATSRALRVLTVVDSLRASAWRWRSTVVRRAGE